MEEYKMDDKEKQQVYTNNCQQVLRDICAVKEIVQELQGTKDIYYPTTSSFNILKLQDIENLIDSIPQLLEEKLTGCINHLNNLTSRVSDTSSKVLVTGDLNSGKSTLVNALLNQDILPVDQQPCTSMFCEVVSSSSSEQQEQSATVHAIIGNVSNYDKNDRDSFHLLESRHLYKVLTADEQELAYKMLKIYVSRDKELIKEESLLYNGVVDIALIDSPGLNTDSVKTTAVFAREEEIDVIVFVVSAENHFTLSGKEFLWNAANEKTHIFIVVNRFDNIRDKDRCKRLILDQIKQLSPSTYEQQENLIHFISAAHQTESMDFIKMEQKLRSFVLNNRIQSKLLPVQNYLTNVLRDIYFISTVNESKATDLLLLNNQNLNSHFLPGYSNFIQVQASVQNQLSQLKSTTLQFIQHNIQHTLNLATSHDQLKQSIRSIPYPGLLLTWQYAQDIVDSLSFQLKDTLYQVESQANKDVLDCMNKMNQLTLDQLNMDIISTTTKEQQQQIIPSKVYQPIQIQVEAKDLLLNRKIVDDKKIAMSGLVTISTATVFIKAMNLKDIAWSVFSSYITYDKERSGRFVTFSLTAVGLLGIGYTAYSFISVIPQALEINLNRKFQQAIEIQQFTCNQTKRISHAVEQLLDTKQNEIVYRIKQLKSQKEEEKSNLENSIFYSKSRLSHFQNLVLKSNDLLVKVEESLVVMSSPLI